MSWSIRTARPAVSLLPIWCWSPLGRPGPDQLAMAKLRPLMTPEELEKLPGIAAEQPPQWIQDENLRKVLCGEIGAVLELGPSEAKAWLAERIG